MKTSHSFFDTKKLDSYSLLVVSKYFESSEDHINVICVNSKVKEITEKLRFNPIPITSTKLFPKMQTQYLYSEDDVMLIQIDNYEIWYTVDYNYYLMFEEYNIKCHSVIFSKENRKEFGYVIPNETIDLGRKCFNKFEEETLIIPKHMTSIGDYCFSNC